MTLLVLIVKLPKQVCKNGQLINRDTKEKISKSKAKERLVFSYYEIL